MAAPVSPEVLADTPHLPVGNQLSRSSGGALVRNFSARSRFPESVSTKRERLASRRSVSFSRSVRLARSCCSLSTLGAPLQLRYLPVQVFEAALPLLYEAVWMAPGRPRLQHSSALSFLAVARSSFLWASSLSV